MGSPMSPGPLLLLRILLPRILAWGFRRLWGFAELGFAIVQCSDQPVQVLVQQLRVRLPRYLIENSFPVRAFLSLIFHTVS